jgi:serine/threonine-protein kinase
MTHTFDHLKAALADRYQIEREIGSGGMATVYLAEDLKHHRKVAVKVLRPELAAAIGPERFLREIEIAAGLQHPHILPLHDSGESGGFLYYVMPYVEGESLRDRLTREKQLPLEDALQMARNVATALSYAHSHDVLHRDIKPENILLSGGEAVVADFGIARAISAAGGEKLTETGVSIGTPAYMSPEQAAGTQDLDGRSDIYSLGCVTYEMLAGEPPFAGPTVESIVRQHLTAEPPSVTVRRATAPIELAEALKKALAKTPADRFATAAQFAEALTAAQTVPRPVEVPPAAVPTAVGEKSRRNLIAYAAVAILAIIGAYTVISRTVGPPESAEAAALPRLAVLPFNNLGSAEDEYFADGITEEITSRIAQISGLNVISRTSAMQYKNHEKTLQQIGEELSVDYVLEGTIRTDRAPDGSGQVRVTPQLIRVSDDAHLWTDRYTANLVAGEVFAVQEQIANQVAGALDVTLLEPERRRLAAQPTDNQEAYEYYLRGNDYYDRSDEEQDFQIAIQMYQKAVDLDPDFASAYARLSIMHSLMWFFFYDRTQERLAVAREAVDEALRLDPDLPEAHRALGQGKFVEALANQKQAAELDPRSAVMAYNVAETYWLVRNPVEAARYFDRAISLSPDLAYPYAAKAEWVHLRLEGSREKARAVLEEAGRVGLAEHPQIAYTWVLLEIWDGDYQQALDRLALVSSDVLWEDQWLHVPKTQLYAQIHGLMGNRQLEQAYCDSTRSMLESRIQQRPDDERLRSALGIAYAGLGRKEGAIREGELAVELLPMSKEAWRGAHRVEELARIYAMVGEYGAAIDQLEILLAVPSPTAVPMLRIDPTWNPLRDHPRFQALLEKYGN